MPVMMNACDDGVPCDDDESQSGCVFIPKNSQIWSKLEQIFKPPLLSSFVVQHAMAIPTVTVANLKKYKNTVIGNPVAKVQLVRDELFVTA